MEKDFINLIKDFMLPIVNRENSLINFMDTHYKKYIEELKQLIKTQKFLDNEFINNLADKIDEIDDICKNIIKILRLYDKGNKIKSHSLFFKLIDDLENRLFIRENNSNITGHEFRYYRIRSTEEKRDYKRKEIFHIPFNKREHISSCRYSIAGYPCIYLSSSSKLCWFECGMPKKFILAEYEFNDEVSKMKIIDFALDSYRFAEWVKSVYISKNKAKKKKRAHELLLNHFITYPIKVACSIIVKNKEANFKHEYVLPQMLLLWVRDNDTYSGIAYHSCTNQNLAPKFGVHNLVLPAKDIGKDGYCKYLKQNLRISKPEYIEISFLLKEIQKKVEVLRDFSEDLLVYYENGMEFKILRNMRSICITFIRIYEDLIDDNYLNGRTYLQTIESLKFSCDQVINNKKILIDNIIEDDVLMKKNNKEKIKRKIFNIFGDFENKVQKVILSAQCSISKIGHSSNKNDDFDYIK